MEVNTGWVSLSNPSLVQDREELRLLRSHRKYVMSSTETWSAFRVEIVKLIKVITSNTT